MMAPNHPAWNDRGNDGMWDWRPAVRRRIARWRRGIARVRIREHLRRAEQELRAADVDDRPPGERRARERTLDRLREYRCGGAFPTNDEAPERTPCFVGGNDEPCAIAALMLADGRESLVADVAAADNTVLLEDCEDERVLEWIEGAGLTRAEAARIQPGYPEAVYFASDCGPVACSTARLIAAAVGAAVFAVLEVVGYRFVSGAFPGNALKRRALLGYVTVANLLLAPLVAALAFVFFP